MAFRVEIHRAKQPFETIREAAASKGSNLGFKYSNNSVIPDNNHTTIAQIALHCSCAKLCHLIFINCGDNDDFEFCEILADNDYFTRVVKDKLVSFFESYYIQELVKNEIVVAK